MHSPIASPGLPFTDTVQAWVPHGHFVIEGAPDGPLAGLRFAAKDVFDVAGQPTGAGNPAWLASHPVATRHSALVQQVLVAGATLCGKVVTDELAYSIHGHNLHYGMPVNSAAPDRIPGGSSSGSVAAVAARLVDFALGTDTGGSTRVPASYCGVWGLRTTHGLVSREGLVPLHPSFDTATWFAHDPATFERVTRALLPATDFKPTRALLLQDAADQADAEVAALLPSALQALRPLVGNGVTTTVAAQGVTLEDWRRHYVAWGAHEAWQAHGNWITQNTPVFEDAIASRWQAAAQVSDDMAQAARTEGLLARARVRAIVGADNVLVLPPAASVAPLRSAAGPEIDAVRVRTLRICCIAGLAGLPQVSLPLLTASGLPAGVSLIGPAGSDVALVRLAIELWRALHPQVAPR
ncbi:MAG: amidase [Gammaproteobacteria bacterium]|nr:amidase [Gammaproteobacteria bacterium]MBU0890220.1 amidase [Gammaproteobacteria bacterium]MBU1815270.1 amidase [Gammaproteobacteria bacterium]